MTIGPGRPLTRNQRAKTQQENRLSRKKKASTSRYQNDLKKK